jgi:hypothetical protein
LEEVNFPLKLQPNFDQKDMIDLWVLNFVCNLPYETQKNSIARNLETNVQKLVLGKLSYFD